MDDLKQQAQRLKALWRSGRDKFSSFFTVLSEVKEEVGDAQLANWCFDELGIGLSIIMRYTELLGVGDDEIVRDGLAAASAVDKKAREEAKFQEALDKARKAKEIAEAKAAAARAKADAKVAVARANTQKKKIEDTEKDRQRKRNSTTERGEVATAKRRRRAFTSNLSETDLAELAKRFELAERLCMDGIGKWIEGSISKALILAAARDRFKADQEFGEWVDRFCSATKPIEPTARAALVGLGRLGEARLREILTSTESRSYQLIWRENKPKPTLVEDDEMAVS